MMLYRRRQRGSNAKRSKYSVKSTGNVGVDESAYEGEVEVWTGSELTMAIEGKRKCASRCGWRDCAGIVLGFGAGVCE